MNVPRFQWLIECKPSKLSQDASVVYVKADILRNESGALTFIRQGATVHDSYVVAAFGPGEWSKAEITEAFAGYGNGIFKAEGAGQ